MVRTHRLKTWPRHYAALVGGSKTFEVRKDDRGFAVGDLLELVEWDPSECMSRALPGCDCSRHATGREISATVMYLLDGGQFGIERGHVVMSLEIDWSREKDGEG